MDHLTEVFEVPLTVAVNVVLWLAVSDAVVGDKVRVTGCNVTVALVLTDVLAALVAVTVMVCELVTEAGAV